MATTEEDAGDYDAYGSDDDHGDTPEFGLFVDVEGADANDNLDCGVCGDDMDLACLCECVDTNAQEPGPTQVRQEAARGLEEMGRREGGVNDIGGKERLATEARDETAALANADAQNSDGVREAAQHDEPDEEHVEMDAAAFPASVGTGARR